MGNIILYGLFTDLIFLKNSLFAAQNMFSAILKFAPLHHAQLNEKADNRTALLQHCNTP